MSEFVLDASAVLAVVNGESGASAVIGCAHRVISAVNLAESASKLRDRGFPEMEAWLAVRDLVQDVAAYDAEQARLTSVLRPLTRALGLSLGDRACLALAQTLKLPVLTADRTWAKLKLGVKVEVIR